MFDYSPVYSYTEKGDSMNTLEKLAILAEGANI
jgi:hypothetical protein